MNVVEQNIARQQIIAACKVFGIRENLESSVSCRRPHIAGISSIELNELLNTKNMTCSFDVVDNTLAAV